MKTESSWLSIGAGGEDEFQGFVDYTFTRPDGTQLGTQGIYPVNYFIQRICIDEVRSTLYLDTDL